ncbi:16S rRNA (guanine(966)-N(2))-methyltransferase RsmD [bacterium]|nr:16S rRNA (guanine(966)-N(2))-methyltransferase RsmD [bacterium]
MNITAGKYKGQKITAPDESITRPTLSKVRMSVFNTLQAMMDFEGASFLDMYSGSGIMGLEALSRGFSKVVMIEKNRKVYNVLKSNIKKYEKDNDIKLILGDSLKVLSHSEQSEESHNFNIIYIDPPYFSGIYEQSLKVASEICKGIIILEHVTEFDLTGYDILKQKKYGDKYITFIKI